MQALLQRALEGHQRAQQAFAARSLTGPAEPGLLSPATLSMAAKIVLGLEVDCSDLALHLANETTVQRFHSLAAPVLRRGSGKPAGEGLSCCAACHTD